MEQEKKVANRLINTLLANKDSLPYINLKSHNEYAGWVANFGLVLPDGLSMKLNLHDEKDLFLLFVLAVAWSRTGAWENAAFFVAYLKFKEKDAVDFWENPSNYKTEAENRIAAAKYAAGHFKGVIPRKKISFREDFYKSIHVLALNWKEVLEWLKISEQQSNYDFFIKHLREIEGLGSSGKRLSIKIPLILRELRCQNVYKGIPGEYCCVPDQRVVDACLELGIKLSKATAFEFVFKKSAKIYQLFGDLYDLPLFAYPDLKDKLVASEDEKKKTPSIFTDQIILQNEQVLMRPLEDSDIDLIASISYSEELGEFGARVKTRTDLEHYFDFCITARKKEELYPFIILAKDSKSPIGITMFGNISLAAKRLEIGWTWIGEQFQGTGINQQCKKLLLDYCFQELGLRRVEFKIDIKNIKSQKAIAKLGAVKEGMLRNYNIQSYGESTGTYVYSILKEEWETALQ